MNDFGGYFILIFWTVVILIAIAKSKQNKLDEKNKATNILNDRKSQIANVIENPSQVSENSLAHQLRSLNQDVLSKYEEEKNWEDKLKRVTKSGFFDFLYCSLLRFASNADKGEAYTLQICEINDRDRKILDRNISGSFTFPSLEEAQEYYNRLHGFNDVPINSLTVDYEFNEDPETYKNWITEYCKSNSLKVKFISESEEYYNSATYFPQTGVGSAGTSHTSTKTWALIEFWY